MRTRVPGAGTPARPALHARLGGRLLSGAVALASAAAVVVLPGAVGAPASAADEPGTTPEVTMVQANIYTKLPVEKFQADVRRVLSLAPDFVTYNELPFRNPAVFAPAGYDYYRGETNRFTKATPVAWRADRWTAVDQGTWMVSDWRGKPPGREVELGRRFANWVTLQGVDGRVLSVVSAHVAPKVRGMPDLNRPSVSRIGKLVEQLAPHGPVLVGGDFNVHYKSGRYPRDLLTAAQLEPTFDTLGNHFATGDHGGHTIDYVFQRGLDALRVVAHSARELASDHDAVVARLAWQSDAPATTTVVRNDPSGTREGQRAVVTTVAGALRSAEPGAIAHVATQRLDSVIVMRQLRRAVARGVQVRLVVPERRPTLRERRAAHVITTSGVPGSWARRCGTRCQQAWTAAGVPRGFVMVSDAAGRWRGRYDVNRVLSGVLVERPSQARVSTGVWALDEGAEMLAALR